MSTESYGDDILTCLVQQQENSSCHYLMVQCIRPGMSIKKTNPDFVNGVPELLVLQLLDRRPMHGYDLVQAIREASAMRLDFGEGCIYPVLHRLEEQKLLASKRELCGGRNRIVYRVTKQGQRRLADSRAAWKEIVEAVSTVLQGSEHGKPALA